MVASFGGRISPLFDLVGRGVAGCFIHLKYTNELIVIVCIINLVGEGGAGQHNLLGIIDWKRCLSSYIIIILQFFSTNFLLWPTAKDLSIYSKIGLKLV